MARSTRFSIQRQSGFGVIAAVCFVLLYAPIATLIFYSFNAGTSIAIWEGFSWRWYEAAWNNRADQGSFTALAAHCRCSGHGFNDGGHHGGTCHDAHPAVSRHYGDLCGHQRSP